MLDIFFPKTTLHAPEPSPTHPGALLFFEGGVVSFPSINTTIDGEESTMIRQIISRSSLWTNSREAKATPPLHYHLYQKERFRCLKGRMLYIRDGKQGSVNPGEEILILPRQVHTFWPDTSVDDDLDVEISTSAGGFDEYFLNSFFGYVSSCIAENVEPNPVQIFMMLDSADVVLGDLPTVIARALNVGARWLGWAVGYKTRYKVFSQL
ncbi:RmlC-like jelly roll fold [Phaffia rhodozyma]|uniref:RmlC-like jelly roll fold n=1 Tax=Phaffia rhodozyma TaxID=264483 RepID=A0A0F7SFA5_PHARH|nr:RmlC-like jelly roll fold [Phaffia rhodozyma]